MVDWIVCVDLWMVRNLEYGVGFYYESCMWLLIILIMIINLEKGLLVVFIGVNLWVVIK